MKRTLQAMLLALVAIMMPNGAWALVFEVDGICYDAWEYDNTAGVIYNENNEYTGNVVIPSTVTYEGTQYSVTGIYSEAFNNCTKLSSITIPKSITDIGIPVFSGCSALSTIVVEEGNTRYDSRNGCNAIIETDNNNLIVGCATTIIPEGVISVGQHAFYGCSGLTTITIPNSVKDIRRGAFENCTSLTTITIPKSVTDIQGEAF